MDKKSVVAIIPARGGSKRIQGKNMAVIKGRTLLAIAIENARRSNLYDRIILSSENRDIINEGKRLGIEVHEREATLADSGCY